MNLPTSKNLGFWGLILVVAGFAYMYVTSLESLARRTNTTFGIYIVFAGMALSLIGLWRHPAHRGWSVVGVVLPLLVWLLAFAFLRP